MIVIAFCQFSGNCPPKPKRAYRLPTEAAHPVDYQKNTWAVVSFVQERREVTWHCTLVVTDQYPAFRGSAAQYAHVVQTIKLGALRGLEIYARLLAKRRGHNELVKVVVGLIADAH